MNNKIILGVTNEQTRNKNIYDIDGNKIDFIGVNNCAFITIILLNCFVILLCIYILFKLIYKFYYTLTFLYNINYTIINKYILNEKSFILFCIMLLLIFALFEIWDEIKLLRKIKTTLLIIRKKLDRIIENLDQLHD